jgi:hypothetical protein
MNHGDSRLLPRLVNRGLMAVTNAAYEPLMPPGPAIARHIALDNTEGYSPETFERI